MRTIFVLFDSLNRSAIEAYGGKTVATPNFNRFSGKATVFDNHYVGSLPCIPARRDLHTGRLNFMHRGWGPLEPFDNSFAKILSENGVYTHLISDHAHYFEEGGWGYAAAFDSWMFIRGQENDPLRAMIEPAWRRLREKYDARHYPLPCRTDGKVSTSRNTDRNTWARSRAAVNSQFLEDEQDFPLAKCFASAVEFLDMNRSADHWFLQLECFDPHEPFSVPDRFKAAYATGYNGKILNWPLYEKVTESEDEVAEIRGNYAALVAMCDEYFGKLLDWVDEQDAWHNTSIVLTTDHGFLLGEHEWWAKSRTPYYQEVAHIPLMIWNPKAQESATRFKGLSQTTDLMPTFLDFHNVPCPSEITSHSLAPCLEGKKSDRESAVLGMFGGPICAVDKQYTYFRFPEARLGWAPYSYTLMPTHMTSHFSIEELRTAKLANPFDFTKGAPLMRIDCSTANAQAGYDILNNWDDGSVLFNINSDPQQSLPLDEPDTIDRLIQIILVHMQAHDAPTELYAYYGLSDPTKTKGDAVFI